LSVKPKQDHFSPKPLTSSLTHMHFFLIYVVLVESLLQSNDSHSLHPLFPSPWCLLKGMAVFRVRLTGCGLPPIMKRLARDTPPPVPCIFFPFQVFVILTALVLRTKEDARLFLFAESRLVVSFFHTVLLLSGLFGPLLPSVWMGDMVHQNLLLCSSPLAQSCSGCLSRKSPPTLPLPFPRSPSS